MKLKFQVAPAALALSAVALGASPGLAYAGQPENGFFKGETAGA